MDFSNFGRKSSLKLKSSKFTVNLMDSGTETNGNDQKTMRFEQEWNVFMASECFVSFEQCYSMHF